MSNSTSLFVAFEGGEGTGKTTQAHMLRDSLVELARTVIIIHEPGTTNLGLYLRTYLKSKQPISPEAELLLFEAARAQLVADEIKPALARGYTIIADRFAASSLAYQGYGRGIDVRDVSTLNDFATGGLTPDLTFLLDLQPHQALTRVNPQMALDLHHNQPQPSRAEDPGQRRFEELPAAFHRRVRHGYLQLARQHPGTWLLIDANLPQEQVAFQVLTAVRNHLDRQTGAAEETP